MQRKHSNRKSKRISEMRDRYRFTRRKLRMKEDTSCVPSKTAYMEDGLDKNGIYYFGDKPEAPLNWRDYEGIDKKLKGTSEHELYDSAFVSPPKFESRMRRNRRMNRGRNEGYRGRRNMYRGLRESIADRYGIIQTLDEVASGLTDNVSDRVFDDTIRYYNNICRKLRCGSNYGAVYVFCGDNYEVCPLEEKRMFNLQPLYKNSKFNAYIGECNGNMFIVDEGEGYNDFRIYARDVSTIECVISQMENLYA